MLIQPEQNRKNTLNFSTDGCIIGSGAGGAIAAAKLAQQGINILVIEEGPFVSRKNFDQNENILLPKLYRWQGGLATDDLSIRILQGRSYGGSTTINWMASLRTPDHVLNQWVNEFGLEDYRPAQMMKYFDEIEKRIHVHDIKENEHNQQNRIILDGCAKLGIKAESVPNNSDGCIGCGGCGLGCAYDAKMDARLTYLNDALEAGAAIFTGVRAETINYISNNNQIINATLLGEEYGFDNRPVKIETQRTIVSGGAVFTPILLQKSGLTKSKALGKFFQIHPVTLAIGFYDRIIDPSYGIPLTSQCDEYSNLDGNGYGFWLEIPPMQIGMLGVNAPAYGLRRSETIRNQRKLGVLLVLVRDGANKKSNGSVEWKRGRPHITYKLSEPDKKHMMLGLEKALEVHFAAGAKQVYTMHSEQIDIFNASDIPKIRHLKNGPNQLSLFSAHPQGTARMGSDPKISVVDKTLEMHYYPGIYIMDGSVHPTALGVNPMETIYAVVSRGIDLSQNLGL
ncbi:MAG: GMC family oxidoreductase N-terminal domain-containing protein [Candidatus Thorarchaeota archaeon]